LENATLCVSKIFHPCPKEDKDRNIRIIKLKLFMMT
jgi:hypothetical protein